LFREHIPLAHQVRRLVLDQVPLIRVLRAGVLAAVEHSLPKHGAELAFGAVWFELVDLGGEDPAWRWTSAEILLGRLLRDDAIYIQGSLFYMLEPVFLERPRRQFSPNAADRLPDGTVK